MNINSLFKGMNIIKVISSINKTLNVVNKAIPLYEQAKPLLKNIGSLTTIINNINTSENKKTNDIQEAKEIKKVSNINLPTFFQ